MGRHLKRDGQGFEGELTFIAAQRLFADGVQTFAFDDPPKVLGANK